MLSPVELADTPSLCTQVAWCCVSRGARDVQRAGKNVVDMVHICQREHLR
eukprot:COSAG01_NODE_43774_length_426_cov_1.082569_1_plen_49_part_10